MDDNMLSFLQNFAALTRMAHESTETGSGEQLLTVLTAHLGAAPESLPLVTEAFPSHRLADTCLILEGLMAGQPSSRILGLSGQQRHHLELSDIVAGHGMNAGGIGEPSYETIAVGPDEERRFVSSGLFLFTHAEAPLAVLLRQANPQYGRNTATLEVLGGNPEAVDGFLKHLRAELRENSIFRGHVISFTANEYSPSAAGITFHRRAQVTKEDVVLPAGTMERIEAQVLGIGEHRENLLSYGAHLKRGVLLYGPPGTGKTHTVRYIASQATDYTVILLSGNTLAYIGEATKMARALQPSIVVLEDCDLIAEDRSFGNGPQPLLFEVLDALDGLEPDSDVAFLLTTNRVELLEEALVQRPGRVDLAMEIPRPDSAARQALLALYGRQLNPGSVTIEKVANLIRGTTASFAKELTRRALLLAALEGRSPGDAHLLKAAEELMSDSATLTRSLLGGTSDPTPASGSEFFPPQGGGNGYASGISFE